MGPITDRSQSITEKTITSLTPQWIMPTRIELDPTTCSDET
jgi:hypothetical protein